MSTASLRRLAVAGAVLVAALVVGLTVWTRLGSGNDSVVSSNGLTGAPAAVKPPAPGSIVLAKEAGALAVALEVPDALRPVLKATVLAPSGDPLSGLRVSFRIGNGELEAEPCGPGCYVAPAPAGSRPHEVEVKLGKGRNVVFRFPANAPAADAIVRRASRVFRHLRTVVFVESLRSGPTGGLFTTWRLEAPDRLTYDIRGGASAVVIGTRRWDRARAGGPWRRSQQQPPLQVPEPSWGDVAVDPHLLGTGRVDGRPVWIVSFANPTVPAWFTAWIERGTYRTLRLRMTAAAHFMFHRYLEFDRPLTIGPPR